MLKWCAANTSKRCYLHRNGIQMNKISIRPIVCIQSLYYSKMRIVHSKKKTVFFKLLFEWLWNTGKMVCSGFSARASIWNHLNAKYFHRRVWAIKFVLPLQRLAAFFMEEDQHRNSRCSRFWFLLHSKPSGWFSFMCIFLIWPIK